MVKFGRKFFFDKVHTKKNYTVPIIISAILLVAITSTFLVTRYYKNDKPKKVEPKIVFKDNFETEIYTELPSIEDYIKEIKNIKTSDLEVNYPEELKLIEETSDCENEEKDNCKKQLVSTLGEFKITIKSAKLTKDAIVNLKVVDKTAPDLKLKEVTITEGETYKVDNFVESCKDNSRLECVYKFYNESKDEDGNTIDYSKYNSPGTYDIKIIAVDTSGNISTAINTKLIINKKKEIINNKPSNNNQTTKPNNNSTNKETNKQETCKYGDLKYSSSYVIATKIDNSKCAISAEEAESMSNKAAASHNKKVVKEIQSAYLQNTIETMQLDGTITYDITYGLVYNSANKGVVGYFLMAEAKQTIKTKTTTIARYYLDENGNRVWKVNALNLK